MLARALASALGYGGTGGADSDNDKSLHLCALHRDMSARDLLQRRVTDEVRLSCWLV